MAFNSSGAVSGAIQGAAGGYSTGGAPGAAVGAVLGGALGGFKKKSNSAKKAYKYWLMQFAEQKKWEKWKMSNAHQLEAADLSAAGINPAVTGAGQGAMNASAPSPSFDSGLASGTEQNNKINSALRAQEIYNSNQRMQAEIQKINEETTGQALNNRIVEKYGSEEKKRQIANTIQETYLKKANTALANETINNRIQEQWLTRAQTGKTQNESTNESLKIPENAKNAKFYRDDKLGLATLATYGKNLAPTINSLTGAAGMIAGAKKFGTLSQALNDAVQTERFDGQTGELKSITRRRRIK